MVVEVFMLLYTATVFEYKISFELIYGPTFDHVYFHNRVQHLFGTIQKILETNIAIYSVCLSATCIFFPCKVFQRIFWKFDL